jgi:hypothetical protein
MRMMSSVSVTQILPLLIGLLAFFSSPAVAEVSDKVPTMTGLWIFPGIVVSIAFVAGVIRPYFALFFLPIGSLYAWFILSDLLHDPSVGPAILQELGDTYFISGYVSILVGVVGPLIIWAVLRRFRPRT